MNNLPPAGEAVVPRRPNDRKSAPPTSAPSAIPTARFEETYIKYEFGPLVTLTIGVAEWSSRRRSLPVRRARQGAQLRLGTLQSSPERIP
jgi:hypothetical protein